MSVKIVTDSSSDITPEEAKRLGITVVPLKVIMEGVEYRDSIDIDNNEFYRKLVTSKELPTTTQPGAADFQQAFEEADEDEIVAVLLASDLSGTVQSATIGSAETEGKDIFIVDSKTAALGERILVMRAVELRDQGFSGQEIARRLEREKEDIVLLAVVDTLTYLHKGGRLSKTAALAGGILGVKPVLTIKVGKIAVLGKERGRGKAFKFLKDTATGIGEIDRQRPCAVGFTADEDALIPFRQVLGEEYAPKDALVDSIGSAIGTHVGPGAVAVAYFKKA